MILDHNGKVIQSPPQARHVIRKRRSAWRSAAPIESGEPMRTARGGMTAIERALYDQVTRSL